MHYQRSLLEVGSSFELEHAQRIALLFLKQKGGQGQLSSWARMFSFEDVPTCALMLKALVSHNLWRSAINLWLWNPNDAVGEALLDELAFNNLWEQSMEVLHQLIVKEGIYRDSIKMKTKDIGEAKDINGDVALALNDAFRLANDPTFIPAEEKKSRGAIPHLVNKIFPLKSQWQQAVSVLVRLSERDISLQTRRELLDIAAARAVYQGEKIADTYSWIRETEYVWRSKSLQRTFFRCALALERYEEAISILEDLSKQGIEGVPSASLQHFCKCFVREYNQGKCVELLDRFAAVVLRCSSRIYSEKTRGELRNFFRSNAVDTTALDVVDLLERTRGSTFVFGDRSVSEDIPASATDIDNAASSLLHKGHWKASLELLKRLVEAKPLNKKEEILIEAARASLNSWKTAILFIA
ncbi:hypothetical protein TraAM80_06875 [Trypanosoma rangeli]|uniref:Uncharacterized protein n=1 Tax=Trypanosoma rangeli TaxID=5698 RepID=A0A3S5IQQ0_TRYRA|nr:uncharacterized protein TraAM80_06875 [Trypanosoma rangeli]RNF01642.1 hypothetical protein TraAM80_06875 [Trypanosoma rangeli]|eukprot:RNF01642.1 hypothetical protein TraAM80_06875 [Trypanosoma rangeli]